MSSADLDRMMHVITAIHPLRRMINSARLDAAFDIVREQLPSLRPQEYHPGEAADDWSVPDRWELEEASLKDSQGRTIVSDADSHSRGTP